MQTRWLALALPLLCVACGGDDGAAMGADADTGVSGQSADGGADAGLPSDGDTAVPLDGDVGAVTGGPSAEALAIGQRAVQVYDRSTRALCECFVADGIYASRDECLGLMGSGPDWAACGAEVLDELDSPGLRETLDCFIERSENQAACYEAAMCEPDAMDACATPALECLMTQFDALLTLLMRCPDLGLLSRVSP